MTKKLNARDPQTILAFRQAEDSLKPSLNAISALAIVPEGWPRCGAPTRSTYAPDFDGMLSYHGNVCPCGNLTRRLWRPSQPPWRTRSCSVACSLANWTRNIQPVSLIRMDSTRLGLSDLANQAHSSSYLHDVIEACIQLSDSHKVYD